jgi:thiamine transport system permease protein
VPTRPRPTDGTGPGRGHGTTRTRGRGRSWWRIGLAVPPLAFLALFFVWPVTAIVVRGLRPDGRWDLSAIGDVVTDPVIRRVAWFTLWQAVLSTVLCVVAGLPGAALFARYRFAGKRLLWAALLVPFVLPTVVVGVALLGVLGPNGVSGVDLSGTIWAILVAHVFFNYAVVVRTVGGSWSTLDPRVEEAARTLGASPWRAFLEVTLPRLRPAISSAASIVFLFTFTSFGVVLILGGIRQRTIEVEIYDQTARFLHLDVAAGLALVQLVAVVLVLVWFGRTQRRRALVLERRPASEVARRAVGWRARSFVAANLAFMAVLFGAPIVVLVAKSFSTPDGWGLANYQALDSARRGSTSFVPPIDAIGNSLLFAAAATLVALVLGACAAWAIAGTGRDGSPRWTRWTDTALMVPLGTSAVTIGFGFFVAFDEAPLDLRSSLWLIPLAHAVVAMPFVVRLLVPALRSIDPELREAAGVLGASPAKVWREIDLPVVSRALAAAAGFAFAVSLGEFGATVFLARPERPTLPVAIYRVLGQPGPLNFGQAMALSVILMALTVVVVLVIDRLRPLGSAEF